MSTSGSDDLRNERERLEIERQRLELERERFAFEQKRSAASAPASHVAQPSAPSKVPIPISMWVIGVAMIVACFLPWVSMRGNYNLGIAGSGSLFLGDASGTSFWQGQLCVLLLIGALIAKHLQNRVAAGICALGAPLLPVHLILQAEGAFGYSQSWSAFGTTASASLRPDPSFGVIPIMLLSIPFAIIAFRQQPMKGAEPIEQRRTLPEVPSFIVHMITVQVILVILLMALLFNYKNPSFLPGATLFFSALHWGICRNQKWTLASYWSLTFLGTVAVNWISVLVYRANRDQMWDPETGNWLLHVALNLSTAIVKGSPFTYVLLGTIAFLFAWSEYRRWKPKFGPLTKVLPRWVNPAIASTIVFAYPLTITLLDAAKLDIPSEAERQHAEMIVRGMTGGPWTVFNPSNPLDRATMHISRNDEGSSEPIRFNDYGRVSVRLYVLLDNWNKLSGTMEFRTSDERWSKKLEFSDQGDQIVLNPERNDLLSVQLTRNRWSERSFTEVRSACPSSIFMRRENTVRSLEEKLRAHGTFLSPRKQKVDLSSLSEELRNEVRALLHAGKAYAEFPPTIQKRIEQENQGMAIPINSTGSDPVAIAKDVLLAQDTAGVTDYRYESVAPLTWVGLTDSTIVIEHRLRFVAASKDGSGEIRSIRTFQSVFDTSGVLLASAESNRMNESVTTYDSDSTYFAEGIFLSASCHENCHVTFRVIMEGRTEEKQLVYLVEDKRIPLFLPNDGQGGAEDLTNPAMIGKRFLLTMKRTAVFSEEGGVGDELPYWAESLVEIAPM